MDAQRSVELALEHHRAGRLDEAIRSYIAALTLDPDHADALCNLAGLLLKRGSAEQAERCYRRTLAAAPAHAVARSELERLEGEKQTRLQDALAEEARGASADAESHIALGKRFKASGAPDKAFAHYDQALSLAPASAA